MEPQSDILVFYSTAMLTWMCGEDDGLLERTIPQAHQKLDEGYLFYSRSKAILDIRKSMVRRLTPPPVNVVPDDVREQLKEVNRAAMEKERPTFKQAVSATKAILTKARVPLTVLHERVVICKECDQSRINGKGVMWCGVCGCDISEQGGKVLNLPAYEEGDIEPSGKVESGCKHPLRGKKKDDGSTYGWPYTEEQLQKLKANFVIRED